MKILIMEEEEPLRTSLILVLKGLHHEVIAAKDGREGLLLFRDHDDIEFVLADYDMPHLKGPEVARCILDMDPTMTICIMTGLPTTHREKKSRAAGAAKMVMKPFTAADLKELLLLKNT